MNQVELYSGFAPRANRYCATPVLAVETSVDPQELRGTCYQAAGWEDFRQAAVRAMPRMLGEDAHERNVISIYRNVPYTPMVVRCYSLPVISSCRNPHGTSRTNASFSLFASSTEGQFIRRRPSSMGLGAAPGRSRIRVPEHQDPSMLEVQNLAAMPLSSSTPQFIGQAHPASNGHHPPIQPHPLGWEHPMDLSTCRRLRAERQIPQTLLAFQSVTSSLSDWDV